MQITVGNQRGLGVMSRTVGGVVNTRTIPLAPKL